MKTAMSKRNANRVRGTSPKRSTVARPRRTAALPVHNGRGNSASAWELRLYIAGKTSRSQVAFSNLKHICETHLKGKYRIEVVDLLKNPQLARGDQIFAVPTLVRRLPEPVKKIIGDLSDVERVLVGLNLRPVREDVQ